MNYKNGMPFIGQRVASVVDSDMHYVAVVAVNLYRNGEELIEELYDHELKDGESWVYACAPAMRNNTDENGFIKPAWGGNGWVESATAEEIAAWEKEHPAPVTEPTEVEQLRADVDYIAMETGVEL